MDGTGDSVVEKGGLEVKGLWVRLCKRSIDVLGMASKEFGKRKPERNTRRVAEQRIAPPLE